MQLLAWCVLVPVLASSAAYEYYQKLTSEEFRPPVTLTEDSFFGYSITYDQVKKNIIASAPRADKDGQIFTCDLETKACIKMGIKKPTDFRSVPSNHHFWSGATVKADSENLVVCAPRYIDRMSMKNGTQHDGTYGRCYMKKLSSPSNNLDYLQQLKVVDRQAGSNHDENLTDSFGWSIDFAEDHSVRVGSPALASGRVMTYKKVATFTSPDLINGYKSQERVSFNFGYSIASGYYFTDKMHVAISTPYGEEGAGKVLFLESDVINSAHKPYNAHWSIKMEDANSFGSLFGASLCSAKLTVSKTSILIGAPAFFADEHRYHTGRVYIYFPSTTTTAEMTIKKFIDGPRDGGFFGYAIANIGDMDQDGLDEIVIAAPYEDDGKGAVYLYPGSVLANDKDIVSAMQRFQPEHVQSFGLSLSPLKNAAKTCNDLAIGAPGNDTVVMYHCIPSITINARLESKLKERTDKKSFIIKSCLKSMKIDPIHDAVTASVQVTVQITHPQATFDHVPNRKYEYKASLSTRSGSEICHPIKVLTPEDGDYDQDILLSLNLTLLNDPAKATRFEPSAGTLSWHSVLTDSLSLRAAECKGTICIPQLSVAVSTSARSPYETGSSISEKLQVVVSNGQGDAAYRPCARVVVEGDVSLKRAPALCPGSDNKHVRTCKLPRALASNNSWNIGSETDITLDMTELTSKSRPVVVKVDVFNRCDMNEVPATSTSIEIPLEHSSRGVRIDGKSDQGEIMNITKVVIRDIGIKIQHKYIITNTHGTNWVGPHCRIWLKKEPYAKYEFPIQIYRKESSQVIPCDLGPHSETKEDYTLDCDFGNLFTKDSITVIIQIHSEPGALEKLLLDEQSNATVQTSVELHFDNTTPVMTKSVTTTMTLQEASVPLWIIIAAALVGLLIVVLIALALRECGLLRRKNNEKLQKLKTEVKRKSMALQRQSVRMPHGLSVDVVRNKTYRELLDAAEAEEAEEALESTGACRRGSAGSHNLLI